MKGRKVKFDKETFIVIAIALAILVGWGIYYPKQQAKQAEYNRQQAMIAKTQAQYAELARKQETENADRKADPLRTVAEKAEPEAVKASPVASTLSLLPLVTFGNEVADFSINPNTGTIDKVEFKQFTTSNKKEPVVYDSVYAPYRTFSLTGLDSWVTVEIGKPVRTENTLTISRTLARKADKIRITQVFTLDKSSYSLKCDITVQNLSSENIVLPGLKIWTAGLPPLRNFSGDVLVRDPRYIEYCPSSAQKAISLDPEMKEEKFKAVNGGIPVDWVGVTNKYFASLLFPSKPFDGGFELRRNAVPNEFGKAGEVYHMPSICGVYKNVALNAGDSL